MKLCILRNLLITSVLLGLTISGETRLAVADNRPLPLIELESMRGVKLSVDEKAATVALRPQAQKEAALSAGIKAGAKWRYTQILKTVVEPQQTELDALFNFVPLLITQGDVTAFPPVITRAGAALRLDDDGTVSVQKGSYKFVRSADIITGVPTWRNYLYMDIPEPEEIHPSILPISGETAGWRKWVDEGWEMGVEQADNLFESNVARLVRDYNGILIYYGLVSEGMIEAPVIQETKTGTHIMAKEVIYDRNLYKVTKDGQFQRPPRQPASDGVRAERKAVRARPQKSAAAAATKAAASPQKRSQLPCVLKHDDLSGTPCGVNE